jgi:hypothetical protein
MKVIFCFGCIFYHLLHAATTLQCFKAMTTYYISYLMSSHNYSPPCYLPL